MKRMNECSNGQIGGGNRRRKKMNGKCVPPNLNKKVLTGPHSEATNNTWSNLALLFTPNKLVAGCPDKSHLPQVCSSMQLIT